MSKNPLETGFAGDAYRSEIGVAGPQGMKPVPANAAR